MIRITFGDREYTLQPDDNNAAPVRLGSKEPGSWVTVLNTGGLRMEVLSGGTKQARIDVVAAESVAIEGETK